MILPMIPRAYSFVLSYSGKAGEAYSPIYNADDLMSRTSRMCVFVVE
jgi:hypothetical protein